MTKPMESSQPLDVVRVAVVEDNPATRADLTAQVRAEPGFQLVAAYPSAEEALQGLPGDWPDVLLMDIRLPGMTGIDAVRSLHRERPELCILMLTAFDHSQYIFDALKAGACGYLLKDRPFEEIADGIRMALKGGAPMSMSVARKVISFFRPIQAAPEGVEALSEREVAVLSALAQGQRAKQVADVLAVSESTVRTYIRRIYEKLHVHSQAEAVARFKDGASRGPVAPNRDGAPGSPS